MATRPLLSVRGLSVAAPGGRKILDDVDFELRPGEVVVLLGGSGAGKSTLMGALDDPASLRGKGFEVSFAARDLDAQIGIVPQRGALFDHLDVAGNLALAQRNAAGVAAGDGRIAEALAAFDLPSQWAQSKRPVHALSGGEAQRVAVARTLAGGRKVLFMDEPSVGLDPLRVDRLADLLRAQIEREGAAALVVTHELAFAAGVADRFVYMDRQTRGLVELEVDPDLLRGPRDRPAREAIASQVAAQCLARLQAEDAVGGAAPAPAGRRWRAALLDRLAPFAVAPSALAQIPRAAGRARDFFEVAWVALKQTALRPLPFFGIVSLLVGVTILYILHRALAGGEMPLRADKVFSLIGSMHVVALAPPLCGILFASTAGNAVTAWLGGVSLTRQDEALRGLGIDPRRYLWLPAWLSMVFAFGLMALVFTGGMLVGGALYLVAQVPDFAGEFSRAWELVSADLVDPPADRVVFRTRMVVLFALYAVGIASDAVAKGAKPKASAESVTVAMVRSVMASTLWIVAIELLSLVWIFAGRSS